MADGMDRRLRAIERKHRQRPRQSGSHHSAHRSEPLSLFVVMNLSERVMTHDQRIAELERQNRELRDGIERLVGLCADQLGLIL